MAQAGFTLVDARGRKYLTGEERARFLAAARAHPRPAIQTFALTLAHTGCRISEALALRARDVDLEASEVRFRTTARLDSEVDVDYYRNGGILHTVLRRMARGNG